MMYDDPIKVIEEMFNKESNESYEAGQENTVDDICRWLEKQSRYWNGRSINAENDISDRRFYDRAIFCKDLAHDIRAGKYKNCFGVVFKAGEDE
jgi:hypothetical protein